MKKIHLLLLSVTLCVFSACHNDIWDAIDGLDSRVTKLEELCKEMNTNITSLQTIVDVLQSNDFITGIVEIKKNGEVIGYTITFGKHAPITIYHGQDGKDGADGKDGQDGQNGSANTPVIGVAQDTDGVYYWTLNGEWLLDDNGNKLPVSGKDGQNGINGSNGQDGADGEDGKDGADGQDGKDGITPQLKIEDGYWYISYDNGATWTQLGKATGEDGKDGVDGENGKDGQNGTDGKDGQDGDSMFQSVTQDENYVYFTLADGTVIKIAKGNGNSQSNDDFIFTITYDPNGGEGVMEKDTFYYGHIGNIDTCVFTKYGCAPKNWNTNQYGNGASYSFGHRMTIDKNIILYAQWTELDSTFSISSNRKIVFSKGNLQYHPRNKEWRFAPKQTDIIGAGNNDIYDNYNGWIDLFGWGTGNNPTETYYTGGKYSEHYHNFVDWGKNKIGNDSPDTWRTLTHAEWSTLLSSKKRVTIDEQKGLLFFPDNWICPIVGMNIKDEMQLSQEQWSLLETTHVIFLPIPGERRGNSYYEPDAWTMCYWSSTKSSSDTDYAYAYSSHYNRMHSCNLGYGLGVRLVKDL